MKGYSILTDINIINSITQTGPGYHRLFEDGFFTQSDQWDQIKLQNTVTDLGIEIKSRLKNRMSVLSKGIYSVLINGPGKDLQESDEICLATGFGEIDTTYKIITNIKIDRYAHVSPTLFHNSVHNTPLGYYTIVNKIHNPCITLSDGFLTSFTFMNYLIKRVQMKNDLVVVSGEEASDFFNLDHTKKCSIIPGFIAFRIKNGLAKGFRFTGKYDTLDQIRDLGFYQESEFIIMKKELFTEHPEMDEKKVFCSYPLHNDNPCGFIYRLAMPFYFNMNGSGLIIEEYQNQYYLFEVKN